LGEKIPDYRLMNFSCEKILKKLIIKNSENCQDNQGSPRKTIRKLKFVGWQKGNYLD
jgi:hypothetical protein